MYFRTSWPQRANLWNAETSQTNAIFAQTSNQLIFSASKVGRATATDLSWLSCIAIKRTELSGALWKAAGPELSGIKTPTAECVSGPQSSIPSLYAAVLQILSWGGLSGVDGGHKLFRQCELLLFFISSIFISPAVCPTYDYDAVDPVSGESASRSESPPPTKKKSCLINKPATSQSPLFQPSVQFWSFSAETALFVRQLLQNVLKLAEQLQVEWCRWLTVEVSLR